MIEVQNISIDESENEHLSVGLFDILLNFTREENECNLSDVEMKSSDENDEKKKSQNDKSDVKHGLKIETKV